MILHAINIAHLNRHVRIRSPDTNVLLLSIHYYPQLPVLVLFKSGSHKINIGVAYEVLGPEKSNALQVNEKSKATCWKAFLDASEGVLTAFADLGVMDDLADLTVASLALVL